ncbi:3-hydroxyisobutyrate dehydrogenase [Methylobacterium sp. Leaf466]|uniref:3-hydroxyisobutyrate dehydrogenase n=1 Tax=Methylobacterium sp. Leaf466 TaxID=1736386 RepID=UPI0006FAD1FC|nr:3-hydroxyisobutyrate dehydrogenase [Methylobacterium sp. Leaf466]KQT87236.1 3-hydroxyisobutyrate dehydrogenase [Methylobacterium sp. Leaf466]
MTPTAIAFLGLGNMGGPMAANLVRAGYRVMGFDPSEDACAAAREAGIGIAPAHEAVAQAAVVVTMLPSGRHLLSALTDMLPHLSPGSLLVDCSTIDVDSARAAHALATEGGHLGLDAPVSGGVGGARAATLTFMVGGSGAALERGRPVLEAMGQRIVHCGAGGAGQAAKICNNMLLGISMIGVAEAFVLAERLGLSHQALFDVASTSSGQCWSLTSYCPVPGPVPTSPANDGYRPGFAAALMLKDLRLAADAATATGSPTPLGAAAERLYAAFVAAGEGGTDFSGIVRHLRDDGVTE